MSALQDRARKADLGKTVSAVEARIADVDQSEQAVEAFLKGYASSTTVGELWAQLCKRGAKAKAEARTLIAEAQRAA